MTDMSADEIVSKYSPEAIKLASDRIKVTDDIRQKLKNTRWSNTDLILKNTTFLIPPLDDNRRPLAVTLHGYGLWISPIYVAHHSGKPDSNFTLHIDEEDEGLVIHVEDAFSLTLSGSYESGFKIEVTEADKETKVLQTYPKYR